MKINNFKIIEDGREITVSCDVFYKKTKTLYFSFPVQYKNYLRVDGDYVVAALYSASQRIGEDLTIDQSVSSSLKSNLVKVDQLFLSWNWPSNKVKIFDKDHIQPTPSLTEGSKGVGCFFSGGVDSFFSLLNHEQDTKKITHFIFVHGFDISLRDKDLFEKTLKNITDIAKAKNISLITVKTNLREIIDDYIDWGHTFGSGLSSVALLLGNGLSEAYIPSSVSNDQLFPWGSDPRLDPLWSTDNLKIIHDGSEFTRLDKIVKRISNSPLALKYLRVCWQNYKGQYNCGVCTKCIRTMIELRAAAVLEKTESFNTPLTFGKLNELKQLSPTERLFFGEVLEYLQKNGKDTELQNAITKVLGRTFAPPSFFQKLSGAIGSIDAKYNKMRLYKMLVKIGAKKP